MAACGLLHLHLAPELLMPRCNPSSPREISPIENILSGNERNKKQILLRSRCVHMAILSFSDLSIVAIDFWGRHYLVYDANFHKLGTCDLIYGIWHFTPVSSKDSYKALDRDSAIRFWLSCLNH